MYLIKAFLLAVVMVAPVERVPTITAEKWVNRLSIQPQDSRNVVVLIFRASDAARLRDDVTGLNRLARRSDLLVVGVTRDREPEVKRFIKATGARFAIGIQSTSGRKLGVTRPPAILSYKSGARVEIEDLDGFAEELEPAPQGGDVDPGRMSETELRTRVEQSEDLSEDLEFLTELRIRMESEAFLDYADELYAQKESWELIWRGNIAYQRHLADPSIEQKQTDMSPGRMAYRKARKERTFPTQELAALLASRTNWTAQEQFDVYAQRAGDDAESLVYRGEWARLLGNTGSRESVDALLDMLDVEPDAHVRFHIAGAISEMHDSPERSDPAMIERLEQALARETDLRWVRPMLEAGIYAMRYGAPEWPKEPE